ncbi:hypothetical protein CPT_Moabite_029 [Serratia phage Moabite]|uniref:Uncharacterized protein n=1 Tax=Serratia phage Moabite TaxID=2587814 RepID=A0A4Y5TR65_9CAUD|nr:hypothetical protein HWC48_gp029 [Serratia phage Moabite]QDB71061.1 hypothetical protein CPT_Moabite_029 [Serratia phage Moabite]UGO54246.1 hypothetical protein HAYMO_264 [Serratia phage vB_SmaM_Haymo]
MERIYRLDYPMSVQVILNKLDGLEAKYRFLYSLVNTAIWTGIYEGESDKTLSFNEHYYNDHIEYVYDDEEMSEETLQARMKELDFLSDLFARPEGINLFENSLATMGRSLSDIVDGLADPVLAVETALISHYDVSVMD